MRKRVLCIYGQQKTRSDCAFSQFDQGVHCSVTDSLDTTECMNGEQRPGWDFARHVQDDLTLQILRMFEGTFSLDMARIIWKPWEKNHLCKSKTVEHLAFSSQILQTTSWRWFSYVWQKIGIDISRKLSPEQTISMKCHILFSVAKLKKKCYRNVVCWTF